MLDPIFFIIYDSLAPLSEHIDADDSATPKLQKKKKTSEAPTPFHNFEQTSEVRNYEVGPPTPNAHDKLCEEYNNKEPKKQLYKKKALEYSSSSSSG